MSELGGTGDDLVLCERDGSVAILTINREAKRNAISVAVSNALITWMHNLESDDDVHVIVITGAGQIAFSAGADMTERSERLARIAPGESEDSVSPAFGVAAIEQATKPVIAAMNGFAYGGGAQLAVGADIRIGSPAAAFRFVGASYGIVNAAANLAAIVGPAVAAELAMSARVVNADEAFRIGLLNKLVPSAELRNATLSLAKDIANNAPAAVCAAKAVIRKANYSAEAFALEVASNAMLLTAPEHAERFTTATNRVVSEKPR